MTGALAVAERIIALLDEGAFTATYKYAVLLGLLDLSLELGAEVGDGSLMVTTRQLAGKVLAAYWPQVRPLPVHDGRIPRQNGQGARDARIVRLIDTYKRSTAREWSVPAEVRLRDQAGYERMLAEVERVLIEMPLPRLQSVGVSDEQFLYTIGWTREVSRTTVSRFLAGQATDFDNRIILRPGVALAFIQLNGLLRPLIQRSWSLKVAQLNHLDEAVLHQFLFGQERSALVRVRAPLVELQEGCCFYCGRRLERSIAVDHFLPWSRVPNDNLENLVAAHARCNGAKRDFLPALEHVARWRARCDDRDRKGQAVGALAAAYRWPSAPAATLGTARAIYGRLPSSAKLWVLGDQFEERGAGPLVI